jgi:hypothetical protein
MLADGMKVAVRLLSVNSFPRDPNIPDEEKSKTSDSWECLGPLSLYYLLV